MDAASEFSDIVETLDSIRADLAEFRHETQRKLDVMDARLDGMNARFDARFDGMNARMDGCATKADVVELKAELKAEFKDGLLLQTRWILAGLVTVILAVYLRA